jgi:hypothetical protein
VVEDPELKAMQEIYRIMNDLQDPEGKVRVIDWVIKKLSMEIKAPKGGNIGQDDVGAIKMDDFESVSDIFTKIDPQTLNDKVLVVGGFLQKKGNGKKELTAREINDELKNLGYPVGNITNAISKLIKKRPQLMLQVRKEGKVKQAQKKYKVTDAGFKHIESLLIGNHEENE